MVTFVKNPIGWNYEFMSTAGMTGKDLRWRGGILVPMAKSQVGKRTGKLAASISSELGMDQKGVFAKVGSGNKIALLHHEGSRPHLIAARRASTLRFVQNGRIRYAKVVKHPGTKPNKYLTDNLPKVMK